MSETIFTRDDVAFACYDDVQKLKEYAEKALYRRSRFCAHHDPSKLFHEMINVFCMDSYIRPHKHPDGKCESYLLIEGELLICFFDDSGNVINQVVLSSYHKNSTFFLRLNKATWHMQIPLTKYVVFLESYQGPFSRNMDVIEAEWAPTTNELEKVQELISRMKEKWHSTKKQ